MDARVPDVHADGVAAVLALHLREAIAGLVESRVPRDRLPARAFAPLRLANAIGIVLDIDDRGRFGADVRAAEGVVRVAAHGLARGTFHLHREPADRLAEHAGVAPLPHRRGRSPGSGPLSGTGAR